MENENEKKKGGRPFSENPRKVFFQFRITPEEHAWLKAQASEAGCGMSEFIRRALNGMGGQVKS